MIGCGWAGVLNVSVGHSSDKFTNSNGHVAPFWTYLVFCCPSKDAELAFMKEWVAPGFTQIRGARQSAARVGVSQRHPPFYPSALSPHDPYFRSVFRRESLRIRDLSQSEIAS